MPDTRRWWFELRLHATYGTLELRVPDAQSSVDDVHGVAAFAYGLMHALAARFDAGEPLPVHDSWRIDENRWAAMRDGVDGTLADLDTGERMPTRELLLRAPGRAARPAATRRALIEANGAIRTRPVGADGAAASPRLISRFLSCLWWPGVVEPVDHAPPRLLGRLRVESGRRCR